MLILRGKQIAPPIFGGALSMRIIYFFLKLRFLPQPRRTNPVPRSNTEVGSGVVTAVAVSAVVAVKLVMDPTGVVIISSDVRAS